MSQTDDRPESETIPLQTENIAFAPGEMVACAECGRKNPPTRLSCVYCGGNVELPEDLRAEVRPTFRRPEDWEMGFSLAVVSGTGADPAEVARAAGADPDFVARLLAFGKPLPLLRIASSAECEVLAERLAALGVTARIVADTELGAGNPPRRLRRIEFKDGGFLFTLFNDDSEIAVAADELELIVAGAVYRRRVEATEKRKKGQSKMLDTTETASDEPVIDLYLRNDAVGYRIGSSGFDFSGLGPEKGIVAAANLKLLVGRLRESSPRTRFDEDYLSARELVGTVWETDVRKDSLGMKRSSFGKFDLASVATSSNLEQFNKYSRLRRLML